MDYRFPFRPSNQEKRYGSFSGRIVELAPYGVRNGRPDSCMILATVEMEEGNIVNFMINASTYMVDFVTLSVGMLCTFWYRTDVPMILIYPPQYTAVVVAQQNENRSVDVSRYDTRLINEDRTLQLNLSRQTRLRTTNNQVFQGNPANHDLVVVYDMSTRSIPAQTTPLEVVVLCE